MTECVVDKLQEFIPKKQKKTDLKIIIKNMIYMEEKQKRCKIGIVFLQKRRERID